MSTSRRSRSRIRALMICFTVMLRGCGAADTSLSDDDAEVLVDWKSSLEDPSKALASWILPASSGENASMSCKSWTGITCNNEGRVLSIALPNLQLKGPLSRALGQLAALQDLNVQNSSLNGSLSEFSFDLLGNLSSLDLSSNSFTGPLPPSIWSLHRLVFLHLSDNPGINGTLPDSISGLSILQDLDLSRTAISGSLPSGFGKLSKLTSIAMRAARLSGPIPAALSTLTNLQTLVLGANALSGSIPDWLGQLSELRQLELNDNQLTGGIPVALKNCSRMYAVNLEKNNLSGSIPGELVESWSATLGAFQVGRNKLSGPLPAEFVNCASLSQLDVGGNQLSGTIPPYLGNLLFIQLLALNNNSFTGSIPTEFGKLFGAALYLQSNRLKVIPEGLCLSNGGAGSIAMLDASDNLLEGSLPTDVNLCANLTELNLSNNSFEGPLPRLDALSALQSLKLANNEFSGSIPSSISSLSSLVELDLANNLLTGPLPASLGNALITLNLRGNGLNGSIPATLMAKPQLANVNVANNNLSGEIPVMPASSNLVQLVLSTNNLSGQVPASLTALSRLKTLDLSDNQLDGPLPVDWSVPKLIAANLSSNSFSGSIPGALAGLASLRQLDLSNNKLEGSIPSQLSNVPLSTFSVSNNALNGSIPGGRLSRFPVTSYSGNPGLCGTPLPNCTAPGGLGIGPFSPPPPSPLRAPPAQVKKSSSSVGVIGGAVGGIVALLALAALIVCLVARKRRRKKGEDRLLAAGLDGQLYGQLKHYKLHEMRSATGNFSPSAQLGAGGHGTVFKGKLPDGTDIAVKRLKKRPLRSNRGNEAFVNELEVISKARHRNILNPLGFCAEKGERLLVFPFIPNGSVADYLQDQRRPELLPLPWAVRQAVALGSAQGLAYMHNGCYPRLIHLDVKAANILLTKDYVPVLADFGLARLVDLDAVEVASQVKGTRGYIAPEHFENGRISDKLDVYGFGVLLLELATGKSAFHLLEEAEAKHMSLRDWVSRMLGSRRIVDIVDSELRDDAEKHAPQIVHLFQVATFCIMDDPEQRPSMQECITMLQGQEFASRYSGWREPSFAEDAAVINIFSPTSTGEESVQAYSLSGPR